MRFGAPQDRRRFASPPLKRISSPDDETAAGPDPDRRVGAGVDLSSRARTRRAPASVTILHINDVYEIDALEGGHSGGLARLATILNGLKQRGGPVIATLGGDYLSPSAIGTARVNGEPLAGQQMVDVLNAVGRRLTEVVRGLVPDGAKRVA